MQTVGIVAISILAGLFLALMCLGLVILLWMQYQTKQWLKDNQANTEKSHTEIERIATEFAAKLKFNLESSTQALTGIRTEIRQNIQSVITNHEKRIQEAIAKINADTLDVGVKRNVEACLKLEKTVATLQNWLIGAAKRVGEEYGPEEFAPETTSLGTPASEYSISSVAAQDQRAEDEAVAVGQTVEE